MHGEVIAPKLWANSALSLLRLFLVLLLLLVM
jgi:hypothetical protein